MDASRPANMNGSVSRVRISKVSMDRSRSTSSGIFYQWVLEMVTWKLRVSRRVRCLLVMCMLMWGSVTITVLFQTPRFAGNTVSLPRSIYFSDNIANMDGDGEHAALTTASCREKALKGLGRAESAHACLHCPEPTPINSSLPICLKYKLEGSLKRSVLLNVLDTRVTSHNWNVTLVTQLSPRRFDRLESLAEAWHGVISVAIYVHAADSWALVLSRICTSTSLKHRNNIFYHLVFKNGNFYPTNVLRNVALSEAPTPYVFVVDIDMLLSPGIDASLHEMLQNTTACTYKHAWVLPAFATTKLTHGSSHMTLSADTRQILESLEQNKLGVYQAETKPESQSATDLDRWLLADAAYTVAYEAGYEPYVVTRKTETPYYPQQFIGKLYNRAVHSEMLYYLGFKFKVLPKLYIVHLAHLDQSHRDNEALAYKGCVDVTYKEFKKDFFTHLQNVNSSKYFSWPVTGQGVFVTV